MPKKNSKNNPSSENRIPTQQNAQNAKPMQNDLQDCKHGHCDKGDRH